MHHYSGKLSSKFSFVLIGTILFLCSGLIIGAQEQAASLNVEGYSVDVTIECVPFPTATSTLVPEPTPAPLVLSLARSTPQAHCSYLPLILNQQPAPTATVAPTATLDPEPTPAP